MLWLEYGWKGRDVWSEIWEVSRRPRFDSWVRKIHWRRDWLPTPIFLGIPGGSAGKESTCSAGDLGSVPGLGRSPGEGKGYPLQYSGLEKSMDYNPWGLKSRIWLSSFHFHSYSFMHHRGQKRCQNKLLIRHQLNWLILPPLFPRC